MQMQVFPDILADAAFKRFLGREDTKHFLMAFLNALLPEEDQIADFEFVNTEEVGDLPHHKTIIYDLHCKTTDGRRIIVEVQRARIRQFVDRALFYTSRLFQRDVKKGANSYELVPTYLVALLDFKFDNNPLYIRKVELRDQVGTLFCDKVKLFFVELPKFDTPAADLSTSLDQWLYTFKHMPTLTAKPPTITDAQLIEFYDQVRIPNIDAEGHALIQRSVRHSMDFREALRYEMEQGVEQGIEKGKEQGIEKGKELSLDAVAIRMFQNGFDVPAICLATGLEEGKVSTIIAKYETSL